MNDRCFACMSLINGDVCEHCGHNNSANNVDFDLLSQGTTIKNRYYLGAALERNGESVIYIAYDVVNNCKVRVCEFFPTTLSHREGSNIAVNLGNEIQYKALMTDYVELSRQLMDASLGGNIVNVIDILAYNETIYTIYEHFDSITLTQFLRENAGELSWEEAEPLFMPLLYAVRLLNAKGIVHRGISPDTILVTKNNELKLKGICTSAVRACNTEIEPELFSGFSAPEQYQRCASHGEWTDVYSIAAVMYRVLTGTTPERADLRGVGESVLSPRKLNINIPAGVSQAIVNAMAYETSDRIQSVKEFINTLYVTPQTQPRAINVHGDTPMPLRREKQFRLPVWAIVILIVLPILLLVFFLMYNTILGGNDTQSSNVTSVINSEFVSSDDILSSDDTLSQSVSSEDTSSAVPSVTVNDFRGKYYEDIIATELYVKWFAFKVKEIYDEDTPIGEVFSQSVDPNKVVPEGTEIELVVSKGAQMVLMPPITDGSGNPITPEGYKDYVESKGLTVKLEYIDAFGTESGQIDSLSVAVGGFADREVVKELIIYVAR